MLNPLSGLAAAASATCIFVATSAKALIARLKSCDNAHLTQNQKRKSRRNALTRMWCAWTEFITALKRRFVLDLNDTHVAFLLS